MKHLRFEECGKFTMGGLDSKLILLFLITLIPMILISCEKEEGYGGDASISGTLTESFFNEDYSRLLYQLPAVDEEIFIQFGDEEISGDRTITGHGGKFRFDYLYPGRYYIYYRSSDSSSVPDEGWSERIPVDLEWGEEMSLGELIRLRTLEYDEGHANIRGVVKLIKYQDESAWPNLVEDYRDFAHEHEVYLVYEDRAFYEERVRTGHDGTFEFRNLIPGSYTVFLYSEDVTRVVEDLVLEYEVEITEIEQVVDLGEITIEEL